MSSVVSVLIILEHAGFAHVVVMPDSDMSEHE